VKIEENSVNQATMDLNVEVEKIGDTGETEDPLDILYDPICICLSSTSIAAFGNCRLQVIIVVVDVNWK